MHPRAVAALELGKVQCNAETALDVIVGDAGRITEEYGGFLIEVLDYRRFPWADVFRTLLRINHEVWVEDRDGRLIIASKPKPD